MVGEQIAAAQAAATAAASTLGSANTQATSTTSLAIGTGARSLVVEPGKAFVVGMPVRIASAASPANRMDGTVTAYNSGTGALDVTVERVSGSGTLASWRVFLTGAGISTADVHGGADVTTTAAGFALTAAASRVQSVSFTADAQSVTLPDATTLSLGGPLYVIRNAGSRTFGVRASGGALLTAVPPGGVAECYLDTNGTAAGQWAVAGRDLQPALTICDATLASTLTESVEVAVRLTDTLSLHFARNASGHPFVFAVDHSTFPATVGTAVLIVASNLTVEHAFRISNTKAMFKVAGTSSNVFNVTVSGTTCTVSSAATAAVFDASTFTGPPTIAALGANSDMFVALDRTGATTIRAQAVDCSGTNPAAGSSVNVSALGTGEVGVIGCFRITDTTALALYIDDSGSAGAPLSIRGVVLSLSGTTITVGTSAGVNDVASSAGLAAGSGLPVCQLAATSYLIGYHQAAGTLFRVVHVGVSGTTTTFGTPLTVETLALSGNYNFTSLNSNRFQPMLCPLTATTALMTWGGSGAFVNTRHAVITNTAGTLTAGTILYGLWAQTSGGNFPQAADGFLAFSTEEARDGLFAVTVDGTALRVSGWLSRGDTRLASSTNPFARFGLSGGVRGIMPTAATGSANFRAGAISLYRFRANSAPLFLGQITINNTNMAGILPVEISGNRAVFTGSSMAQNSSAPTARFSILEFAA
jgi:hypothetical protein